MKEYIQRFRDIPNSLTFWSEMILFPVIIILFYSTAAALNKSVSHINTDSLISKLKTANAGTYYWEIKSTNDWNDLNTFLPKAKISGITVCISLLPPSKTPPICPSGSFSEPYQLDYITWAKEIAFLSLRYSNIIGYNIEDLGENINLGYLKESYINSVEQESESINPKLQFIKAANTYYVDKNATGNGSGSSWTNAATALSKLNWSIINGGDTLFISGGIDSVIYPQDFIKDKRADRIITITGGKDKGHNGKVIFSANAINNFGATLAIDNCRNIKLTGITVEWKIDNENKYCNNLFVHGSSQCYVDNNHLITDGHCAPLFLHTDTSISVTNNNLETILNSVNETKQNDQDGIDVEFGGGGHTITGNRIHIRGLNGTVWHIDCMQWYKEGSTENLQTVIAGNFFYDVVPSAIYNGSAIYMAGCYSNRFLVYNNVVCGNTTSWDGFNFIGNPGYQTSVRLLNNTILNGSPKAACLLFSNLDTLIIENNIVINDVTASKEILMVNPATINYMQSDFNHWYSRNRAWNNWTESIDILWTTWQGMGYDTHSQNSPVTLANPYDTDSITGYKVTSGSINGKDLSQYFETDILGKTRLPDSWDMGALQSR